MGDREVLLKAGELEGAVLLVSSGERPGSRETSRCTGSRTTRNYLVQNVSSVAAQRPHSAFAKRKYRASIHSALVLQ